MIILCVGSLLKNILKSRVFVGRRRLRVTPSEPQLPGFEYNTSGTNTWHMHTYKLLILFIQTIERFIPGGEKDSRRNLKLDNLHITRKSPHDEFVDKKNCSIRGETSDDRGPQPTGENPKSSFPVAFDDTVQYS